MNKLKCLCLGRDLADVWADAEVKAAVGILRRRFQDDVNAWATRDHKRHIPVYISLKPKMRLNGLYHERRRGSGSITIFPIKALPYRPVSGVLSDAEMAEVVMHEYAHHLTGTAHGRNFQDNLKYTKSKRGAR